MLASSLYPSNFGNFKYIFPAWSRNETGIGGSTCGYFLRTCAPFRHEIDNLGFRVVAYRPAKTSG